MADVLSTHDTFWASYGEGSDVHAAWWTGSVPWDADRILRGNSSDCAYKFVYLAETVSAGKHADSFDVHSLAIEVP